MVYLSGETSLGYKGCSYYHDKPIHSQICGMSEVLPVCARVIRVVSCQVKLPLLLLLTAFICTACVPSTDETKVVGRPPVVDLDQFDDEVRTFLEAKQEAVEAQPSSALAHGELAMAFEMNGLLDASLVAYSQAATLEPSAPEWPYYQGLVLASMGDYESAIRALKRSIEVDSNDHLGSYYWLGVMQLELNQLREAEQSFKKAEALGSIHAAKLGRAQVKMREGEFQDAHQLLLDLAEQGNHLQLELLLNRTKKHLGLSDEDHVSSATESLDLNDWIGERSQHKQQFEASLSAVLARVRTLLQLPETEAQAHELISRYHTKYPNNERVVTMQLQSLTLQGKVEQYNTLLQSAYERWPTNLTFVAGMAELATRTLPSAEAIRLLTEWIALDETTVPGRVLLAVTQMEGGQAEKARDLLTNALPFDEAGLAHLTLGYVLLELNQPTLSSCYFEVARTLNSEHAPEVIDRLKNLEQAGIKHKTPEVTVSGDFFCNY